MNLLRIPQIIIEVVFLDVCIECQWVKSEHPWDDWLEKLYDCAFKVRLPGSNESDSDTEILGKDFSITKTRSGN